MTIISYTNIQQYDTTAVCGRNSIADISFYDPDNIFANLPLESFNRFPFLFIEKTRQTELKERTSLIKHLKTGQDLPLQPFHYDWIIGFILFASLLYSFIRTISKNLLQDLTRFLLFRGINDPEIRDAGGLFNWQSTLLNLISFLIIGLFAFFAAAYFNLIPSGISGIYSWLISAGVVITAATLRHIVCLITGNLSGEKEAFREYLFGINQSYRFSALVLFFLVILISYSVLFPARESIISGIIMLGIMYFICAIRLMIIFLNRNISIFYLILYLCALEILPVMISVKYFTGLV
jgi:hypothetical protein